MESGNVERLDSGQLLAGSIDLLNVTGSSTAVELQETVTSLISSQVLTLYVLINRCSLTLIISVLGTVTNVMNIIVFAKQGFQDTINISLMSLAIADLGAVLTLIWMSICYNPLLAESDQVRFKSTEIQVLTGALPHAYFTKVTNLITAFITFERCLCVIVPLKVKRIVTKKVALAFNVGAFVTMIMSSLFPSYYTVYIDWKFYPKENKTFWGIIYKSNREEVEQISYPFSHFVLPFLCFFITIACSAVIVAKLRSKSKWRQSASGASMVTKESEMSMKDRRTSVMVISIAAIFVTSFVPFSVVLLVRSFVHGFMRNGRLANIFIFMSSTCFLLESINSTINILVYYCMSTKYREVFRQTFCGRVDKK